MRGNTQPDATDLLTAVLWTVASVWVRTPVMFLVFCGPKYTKSSLLVRENSWRAGGRNTRLFKQYSKLNKKGQLSLTNPRDACETIAQFM